MSGRRYVKSREKARRLGVGAGFLFLGFTLLLSGELLVSDRCVWDRMGNGMIPLGCARDDTRRTRAVFYSTKQMTHVHTHASQTDLVRLTVRACIREVRVTRQIQFRPA